MKKIKVLVFLLIVLLAAAVLLHLANAGYFKSGEVKTVYESRPMYDYDMDSVTALEWNYEGEHYRFSRSAEGVWTYDGDPSLRINQDHLQGMLIIHHQMATTKAIDGVDNYSEYGLDPAAEPTVTVWVGENSYPAWIGGRTPLTKDYIYAADKDGVVYVVDQYVETAYQYKLEDTLADKPEQ